MPLTRSDLADACQRNDIIVDAGGSVPGVMMTLGVDPMGAVYVAEQRALRVALLHSGVTPAILRAVAQRDAVIPLKLHKRQRDLIPIYAGVWTDGLIAGVRAYYTALST